MRSIENCDLSCPRLDSPNSLQALRRLGLQQQDLQPLTSRKFAGSLLSPQAFTKHFQSFEQRRLQRIEEVKELRRQLLSNSPTKASSTSPMSTSRLKPFPLREKHALEVIWSQRMRQLKHLREAEFFYRSRDTQKLLDSQSGLERSRMMNREKYRQSQTLGKTQLRSNLTENRLKRELKNLTILQAKKEELQVQLRQLKTPCKCVKEHLQEVTVRVQAAKERLKAKSGTQVSPVRKAQANLMKLLDQQVELKEQLHLRDKTVEERLLHRRQQRMTRIQSFAQKQKERKVRSQLARQLKDDELEQKRKAVEAEMRKADSQVQRARSVMRDQSRLKGEISLLRTADILHNREILRRAQDYSRQVTLQRIQEENLQTTERQVLKAQQARQRQQLSKQLLLERHTITRTFERLMSQRHGYAEGV